MSEPSHLPDAETLQAAAALFRALGEPGRLGVLCLLRGGELRVSEIAEAMGDGMPVISQRLRLLHKDRLVRRRREGRNVWYALDDDHVRCLVEDGLAHGLERL